MHFLTDNDSIGEAICKRAEALNAAAVVMAKHQRGAIAEFFLGSGEALVLGGRRWRSGRGSCGSNKLGPSTGAARLQVMAFPCLLPHPTPVPPAPPASCTSPLRQHLPLT